MTAGSYEIVVLQAPVLFPNSSTVLPASGMQLCTNPAALDSTRTLRGFFGFAGACAGKAAIIGVTSSGFGV